MHIEVAGIETLGTATTCVYLRFWNFLRRLTASLRQVLFCWRATGQGAGGGERGGSLDEAPARETPIRLRFGQVILLSLPRV